VKLRERVISGLKWSVLGQVVGQLFTWVTTIIIIRLLAPEDYALIAMASLVFGFSELFRELGFGAAVIQKKEISESELKTIFGAVILTHVSLFWLSYVLAPLVAGFFGEELLIDIIRVSSLQLLILMFMVIPSARLYRSMRFKWIATLQATSMISASLITLAMAYLGYGVWALVIGQMSTSVIKTLGMFWASPYYHLPSFKFSQVKRLLSFSSNVMLSDVIYYFYVRADVVVVGKLLGDAMLGFYTVAYNLATLPMHKISGLLSSVGFSAYANIQDDKDKIRKNFLLTIEMNSLVFFPVLWGISAVSADLVYVLLGDKWMLSAPVMQIIPLVVPLQMTGPLVRPALLGMGRADIFLRNVVTNFLCVTPSLVIGSYWGLQGVCWGWVLGFSMAYLFNMRRVLTVFEVDAIKFLRVLMIPMLLSLAMYLSVVLLNNYLLVGLESYQRLMLASLLGCLVYVGLCLSLNKKSVHGFILAIR